MKINRPTILFLCTASYLNRERRGFAEALQKIARVECLDRFSGDVTEAIGSESPDLVLHPDVQRAYLPEGLESLDCPTACLHIDTYSATENRARMSLLFDVALVCHPGYPEIFSKRGHPEPLLFPHGVRSSFYNAPLPPATVDVAMVGRLHGDEYSYRRRCVERVVDRLDIATNDYEAWHDYSDMAETYRKARIGLNVSREGHLRDANLRCFEVMGGGALLMTPLPTELTDLGLDEGTHFIGFHTPEDLLDKVQYYLTHEEEREEIALRGREVTLDRFTYDRWAERLVKRIEEGIPRQAPGRSMSTGKAASIYVDYYSKRGKIDESLYHLRRQRRAGGGTLLRSMAKAGKATVRGWQNTLFS